MAQGIVRREARHHRDICSAKQAAKIIQLPSGFPQRHDIKVVTYGGGYAGTV